MTKGAVVAEGSSAGTAGKERRRSAVLVFLRRLFREKPLGAAGGIVLLLFLLAGVFAGVIAPYGMNDPLEGKNLAPPSRGIPLGADGVGRDMLSRVIWGAQVSVIVGLAASLLSIVLSLVMGILSGYLGGVLDMAMQRFVDAFMCIPQLILMIIMTAALGPGMYQIIVVLGLTYGIVGSRVIRGAVITLKQNVYVEAARVVGCSTTRIFVRHILPNVMALTIVLFTSRLPGVILAEASLSFLGFGIPAPVPSWGGMISQARGVWLRAPWISLWPGVALAIVVYGVNMFGDAVRDLLDPKLRGGAGRFGVRPKRGVPARA